MVRFEGANATAAVVLTVTVWVPLPPFTVGDPNVQVGGKVVTGVIAHVKFTVELKPPDGMIVTVDVAEFPALILVGESGVAVMEKDGGAAAVMVRLAVVV